MNQRPVGITIIAVLVAIQGVFGILMGLEAARITDFGLGALADNQYQGYADIILGVITLVVSYGLFSLQGWAWVLAVIVTVIRIVTGVWAAIVAGFDSTLGLSGISAAVVAAIFLWYFMRPNVRSAFGR